MFDLFIKLGYREEIVGEIGVIDDGSLSGVDQSCYGNLRTAIVGGFDSEEWASSRPNWSLFPWLSVPTTRHEYDLYRDDQCYGSFLNPCLGRLLSASGWTRA
jgi:hypothetical protein